MAQRRPLSLQARSTVAAGLALAAFLGVTGFALDRAYYDATVAAMRDRLQGYVYAYLAGSDVLRGSKLLSGYRNAAPANVEAFAQAVCRASELICNLQDHVAELDINPVKLSAANATAVDALIVLREKEDKQ